MKTNFVQDTLLHIAFDQVKYIAVLTGFSVAYRIDLVKSYLSRIA